MPEVERRGDQAPEIDLTEMMPAGTSLPDVGAPLPPVKRMSRRGFAHKAFKVLGGGALAVGAVTMLGVDPKEAEAYTCTCGVYYTGQWSCEYSYRTGYGLRTGRVSLYYQGRLRIGPTTCGSTCGYWGVWHCDQTYCPGCAEHLCC